MNPSKIKHLLCFTVIFLLFYVGNADAKNPLPEFFGVYALYNGKLVELQSHPQSQYAISGMTVMGADVLSQLSGITFPEGSIEFIVFRKDATDYSKIPLVKISRIAWQHNTGWGGSGKREKLQNSFHLTNKNIMLNVKSGRLELPALSIFHVIKVSVLMIFQKVMIGQINVIFAS